MTRCDVRQYTVGDDAGVDEDLGAIGARNVAGFFHRIDIGVQRVAVAQEAGQAGVMCAKDVTPVVDLGSQYVILPRVGVGTGNRDRLRARSEEHTSELQSQSNLVCRLLLEKKTISRHTDSCPR